MVLHGIEYVLNCIQLLPIVFFITAFNKIYVIILYFGMNMLGLWDVNEENKEYFECVSRTQEPREELAVLPCPTDHSEGLRLTLKIIWF